MEETNYLSTEAIKRVLPKHMKTALTPRLVHEINQCVEDPYVAESIRENFISYSHVIGTGKFSLREYLNAVKYTSFRMMGRGVKESYIKTFPDRYKRLVDRGASDDDISSYAKMYSKGRLPTSIMEKALIPSWLLNHDIFQKAINTQAQLMQSAKSERVRMMAADSLLNHLKRPEAALPAVQIDMRETQGIADLRKTLMDLAEAQKKTIIDGILSPKDIVEAEIVDAEPGNKKEES